MMPATRHPSLIDRLPPVRGRLTADVPLAPVTWFRVGGPAELLFRPADREDLIQFLAAKPEDVPVTVIGVASNLLVRDGGVPGVVIRLGRPFAEVAIEGEDLRAAPVPARSTAMSRWPAPRPGWAVSNSCPASRARSAAPCA